MHLHDIIYTREGRIGLVTLNRPAVLNAVRRKTWEDLAAVLEEIKADDSVRCLVITGTGKAFCAGQDLSELGALIGETVDYYAVRQGVELMQNVTRQLVDLPKPVLAAVNGYAVGAGAEIAIASDIRYASTKGKFEFAEVKVGLFETNGVTYLLPRLIGLGRAKELMLTGLKIDAAESLRIGLVTRVCAPETLLSETMQAAEKIAANAPIPVRLVKSCLNKSGETSLDAALVYETDAVMTCCYTEDLREGAAAFLENRKPNFKGR
ncbi:MAG: enoyl-CoA hydratase/isomerase family protein [Bacillota bacterium]